MTIILNNNQKTLTRVPLWLQGKLVGSVLPSDAALSPTPLSYYENNNINQGFELPSDTITCNQVLAAWAKALQAAHRLPTWRNELLNIAALPKPEDCLTHLPQALAQVERGAARVLGILTHAVHLVGITDDGRIWLQQRALTKATDAGLWDTLAGGLLSCEDTLISGMLRETYEEAGLLPNQLSPIKFCGMVQHRCPSPDGFMIEAVWVYLATVLPPATPHNLDGEVMGFACVTPAQLAEYSAAHQVAYEAILAFQLAGVLK